jgi:hypothetical protein
MIKTKEELQDHFNEFVGLPKEMFENQVERFCHQPEWGRHCQVESKQGWHWYS